MMELQTIQPVPTEVKPSHGRQSKGTGGKKGHGKEHRIEPVRFKTRMCKHYERDGHCPYAPKCAFAHGPEDMRSIEINANAGITRLSRLKTLQNKMAAAELWQQQERTTWDPHAHYGCMSCYVPPPPPPPCMGGLYTPSKLPTMYVHDPYSTSTPYREVRSSCSTDTDDVDMSSMLETASTSS